MHAFSRVQLRDQQVCCSAVVKPRRFLAQDPEVDYEVMSDEEWEAEPEGEDLLVSWPVWSIPVIVATVDGTWEEEQQERREVFRHSCDGGNCWWDTREVAAGLEGSVIFRQDCMHSGLQCTHAQCLHGVPVDSRQWPLLHIC